MEPKPSRRLLAIADDLSGAAETAAGLESRTTRSRVVLVGDSAAPRHPGEATVLDLDSRHLPAAEAAEAVRAALALPPPGDPLVLKKIDSLLRGNVAAEVAALAADGAGVVVAPALPAAGRAVRAGVVHLGATPLHHSDAWRAEPAPPPRSVRGALGPARSALIPLTAVRTSRRTLLTALRSALAEGRVAVCDAETDADLDAIVEAALADGPGTRLVGSGGLAAAVGRHLTGGEPLQAETATETAAPPRATAVTTGTRPLLVVVGTAEPSAAEQIRRLAADGAIVLRLPLDALCADGSAAPMAPPPLHDDAVTVLTPAPGPAPAALAPRRLVHGLARAVAAALARHDGTVDLVLTGGETARRVLDTLGVTELHPVGQVHHGAVHLRTPDGRSVVTRPGSFGDADSLRQIVHALRPHPTQRKVRP
ncbi:four-carbon acid sugar kinase family protein [Streptomyces sp. ME19-01-6]|uniref:four-carbon acid sugar kinase family protein n=1 Tax=Streptomyces sp. ME19-01-6 TaxID=3028686 RepID=UPI0029AF4E86|nr:four-carbon acid sugar kinase family protein [Streptomyces sp. ME19-01-6]MDX3231932.1 four-carbon acid sugar kinase family protein [Streptomyces sp. ME19-01-6]